METKLCRICGKLGENYVHIFKTEGLKNKIETCLPIIVSASFLAFKLFLLCTCVNIDVPGIFINKTVILISRFVYLFKLLLTMHVVVGNIEFLNLTIKSYVYCFSNNTCLIIFHQVSPHCLLPDTICSECLENVDNFYSFIKNCLQNIIVLEAQYDITESCLKTKRKHEKSSLTDFNTVKFDKNIQTDDEGLTNKKTCGLNLVDYDVDSDDSHSEHEDNILQGKVVIAPKTQVKKIVPTNTSINYFDDAEKDLISEIAQRKSLKRKSDTILPYQTKIFKMDTSNRRKNRQPKKLEYRNSESGLHMNALERICEQIERNSMINFTDMSKLDEYTEEDKLSALEQVILFYFVQNNQ